LDLPAIDKLQRFRWPLVLAIVLGYWGFGLYPYQLPPYQNGAAFSANNVIEFAEPGIAFSSTPPVWAADAARSGTLRLSIEFRSAPYQVHRRARIVSLAGKRRDQKIAVGQEGGDLVLRVPSRTPDACRGTARHTADGVLAQPGWHNIELSLSTDLISVRADGHEVLRQTLQIAPLREWYPDYRLTFANEPAFNRPWLGELRAATVTVAGEVHDYMLPGALHIPAYYEPPLGDRYIQWVPLSDICNGTSALVDKLVNLLGFVPFGVLLVVVFPGSMSVRFATLLSLVLSLSIEVGQLWLPSRSPSLDDLFLNTLGGTLGAWLASIGRQRFQA
jgi:hypothetical protein